VQTRPLLLFVPKSEMHEKYWKTLKFIFQPQNRITASRGPRINHEAEEEEEEEIASPCERSSNTATTNYLLVECRPISTNDTNVQ